VAPATTDGERLAQVLTTIEDPDLRSRRAGALLTALPSDAAIRLLAEVLLAAGRGHRDALSALEAILRELHARPGDPLLADLRAAALEADERDLAAVLSLRAPARVLDKGEPGYVDREMTARTLGHRKTMARGQNRDVLARLAHDQDPAVVRNLLENPRLTEREVLIAASRRPTDASILEEVFRSRRWSSNRRVRKALALNPYSPPALAAAALTLLTAPELREVAHDSHLRDEVREHARRLLALRAGG
jgi:hypothetical protein